jgi:3-oxoacyl-ACP reductase-like protein
MGKVKDLMEDQISNICDQYIAGEIDETSTRAMLSVFKPDAYNLEEFMTELNATKQREYIRDNLHRMEHVTNIMSTAAVKAMLEIAVPMTREESVALMLNAAMHSCAQVPTQFLKDVASEVDTASLLNVFLITFLRHMYPDHGDMRKCLELIMYEIEQEDLNNATFH